MLGLTFGTSCVGPILRDESRFFCFCVGWAYTGVGERVVPSIGMLAVHTALELVSEGETSFMGEYLCYESMSAIVSDTPVTMGLQCT